MKRKLFGFILFMSVMIGVAVPSGVVLADCDAGFAGFVPWHYKLTKDAKTCEVKIENEDGIKGAVAVIASNVAIDLTMAVGYIAVAMIGWGGYLYILSSGDAGKMASAKKTITAAIIGLVISLSASNIAKFISGALGTSGDIDVMNLIKTFLSVAGIVSVGMIVMSGFKYITAQGDPARVKQATQGIIWALVGLVITILAFAVVNFVMGAVL